MLKLNNPFIHLHRVDATQNRSCEIWRILTISSLRIIHKSTRHRSECEAHTKLRFTDIEKTFSGDRRVANKRNQFPASRKESGSGSYATAVAISGRGATAELSTCQERLGFLNARFVRLRRRFCGSCNCPLSPLVTDQRPPTCAIGWSAQSDQEAGLVRRRPFIERTR